MSQNNFHVIKRILMSQNDSVVIKMIAIAMCHIKIPGCHVRRTSFHDHTSIGKFLLIVQSSNP